MTKINWKNEFKKEIEQISDNKLKTAAYKMAAKLPNYFWKVPASSSGKYHPKCDLGDGGLVRHSIMVTRAAEDLVISEMFVRDTKVNRDIARVAALFHDGLKHGKVAEDESYPDHTVFEHPLCAADFVRENLEAEKVDDLKITMIVDAIRTHMGKWCTSNYSKVALSKPRTDFEKMIHLADYVASRKYIKGLDEWFEEPKKDEEKKEENNDN